jgi:hypothetical protein
MTRRIGILLGLALSLSLLAAEPFQVQIIKSVPLAKDEIYSQTLIWMAENFKSSKSVIDMKDKELGVIIGNGAVDVNLGSKFLPVNNTFTFKMKVEMKDNKLRLTFSNVKMVVQGYEKPIEQTNRKANEKRMTREFNDIADQLGAHLSRSKGANW